MRLQRIQQAESSKTEPNALASIELQRHLNAQYKRGDARYVATLDEQIEELKAAKLEDVRGFYAQFYGPGEGEIVVSGQFDPEQIKKLVTASSSATGRAPAATSASCGSMRRPKRSTGRSKRRTNRTRSFWPERR